MNTIQKKRKQHSGRTLAVATMAATALALTLIGCGGGGEGATTAATVPTPPVPTPAPTPDPVPVPAQTTAALQGIWQSTSGADQGVTAIVLPDGQFWSVISSAGATRLVKAGLVARAAGFGGGGRSYTLGDSGAASHIEATVSATVLEKTSLAGGITAAGSATEPYALAYQGRYDTAAALADFVGDWQATLGPGIVNWSVNAAGALGGTRTTGCTYSGQLALRAERKAVVDVAITENCAGTLAQFKGVAVLSADKSRISMAATTTDETVAVLLSLAH